MADSGDVREIAEKLLTGSAKDDQEICLQKVWDDHLRNFDFAKCP